MHLLLRRRQHGEEGWLSTAIVFELEGRLDLDEEERFLFDKYELGDRVVYNSDAFLQHLYDADGYREAAGKAQETFLRARDVSEAVGGFAEIFGNSVLALTYNLLGKVSLQLTLQNLLDGFHVESEDLEEILAVEDRTRESVKFTADYLDTVCTFDGSEELSEH